MRFRQRFKLFYFVIYMLEREAQKHILTGLKYFLHLHTQGRRQGVCLGKVKCLSADQFAERGGGANPTHFPSTCTFLFPKLS